MIRIITLFLIIANLNYAYFAVDHFLGDYWLALPTKITIFALGLWHVVIFVYAVIERMESDG